MTRKDIEAFGSLLCAHLELEKTQAEFAIAGGCFKAILTQRPPRDVDIWPFSDESRYFLINRLKESGAVLLDENRFNSRYMLNGVVVEVVRRIFPSLADVVASFDLVLSAVGVTVIGGEVRDAYLHRLFNKALELQAPLLIKPMPNFPFMLVTVERLKRYAEELGFPLPVRQLAHLRWRFSKLSYTQKSDLVSNYELVIGKRCAPEELFFGVSIGEE